MSLPKVLVVDDDPDVQKEISDKLNGKAHIISAISIEEAEEAFHRNRDLALIIVDACVPFNTDPSAPRNTPNTTPLIQEIRRTFVSNIIGISNLACRRRTLKYAGCNHTSSKSRAGEKALNLLGSWD